MDRLVSIVTRVVDVLLVPFGAHRLAALLAASALSGAAFALLFGRVSNQGAIARAREVFKARILELRLYPDDVVLITRAFGAAMAAQGAYLRHAARGILAVLILAVPVFIQLEQRFAADALAPRSRTLVTATLAEGLDPRAVDARLDGSAGVTVDPRSVRVRATRELVWVVKVDAPGRRHNLELKVGSEFYRFPLEARESCGVIGRERVAGSRVSGGTQLGLPSISPDSPLEAVRVRYPDAAYRLGIVSAGWWVPFLLGTALGALIPARLMRIHL